MDASVQPVWPVLVRAGLQASALVGLYFVLPISERSWPVGVFLGVAVVLAMLPMLIGRSRRIMRSPTPISDAVTTIALIITLAVVGFASTHYALARHATGQIEGIDTKLDALYFTVTVLSTTGFGDIRPAGQIARAVTTAQIVFDVVILALGVRLVTWAARFRTGGVEAGIEPREGDASELRSSVSRREGGQP